MPFATALKHSLTTRRSRVPVELANGDSLQWVLNRYLLAVEAMAEPEVLTSILLLDADGRRLFHGAAPNLPASYCQAIDGGEIGPRAGSCGTAAYLGEPIYVTDIATDLLWSDYRDIALSHDLRSCWSTPIRDGDGGVIGTFAIYHRTVGRPTSAEIETIQMITKHVADAIILARRDRDGEARTASRLRTKPKLRLVVDDSPPSDWFGGLRRVQEKLQQHAEELDRCAKSHGTGAVADALRAAAADCKNLSGVIRSQVDPYHPSEEG